MKKSIVALAVSSAALASVSAYAADNASVDYFGNIQYAYVTANPDEAGQVSTNDFKDNGSSLGFKGESQVSDSSTAFFYVKYKVDATTKSSDASVAMDSAYVGVKNNDYGTVKVGSFDSIYNDAIQDGVNQFEYLGLHNNSTSAEGKTFAYFSPEMSGFQAQLSMGTGTKTADAATGTVLTKSNTATTAVLKYSTDVVSVALGYDDLAKSTTLGDTIGLAVTFTGVENLSVTGKYEKTTDKNSSNAGAKTFGLAARYSYGMGDVYGSYQKVNQDLSTAKDYNEYGIGATYSINSSMYVYVEVGQGDTSSSTVTQNETQQTIMGVTYSF